MHCMRVRVRMSPQWALYYKDTEVISDLEF